MPEKLDAASGPPKALKGALKLNLDKTFEVQFQNIHYNPQKAKYTMPERYLLLRAHLKALKVSLLQTCVKHSK